MSPDLRALLYAVLALQNGFIDHAGLIAALKDWIRNKQLSMGAILLDHERIDAATDRVLQALVERHLDLHGDAERSLAGLSPSSSLTAEWTPELKELKDPGIQSALGFLLGSRAGPDPGPDGPASAAPLPSTEEAPQDPGAGDDQSTASLGAELLAGGRYQRLRPYARGNLGEVWLAFDSEIHRVVALKQIRPYHAHRTDSREQFVREAQVTGGLEHPGIVPIHSLGADPDGGPYYAMRFIRGESLKQAIRRLHASRDASPAVPRLHAASNASPAAPQPDPDAPAPDAPAERIDWDEGLRDLLRRFLAVCDAIAYAHSRRILHRDLKPANIMVGDFGETLVVDWGLAWPFDRPDVSDLSPEGPLRPPSAAGSGSDSHTPARPAGTPAYMSPEQVDGVLDRLGPASDVYGLGATLYQILTGRPAFHGPKSEVFRRVRRGEFPRPREFDRRIPPALEAICRKAMALRPEDRYPTARDLACDLKRWLDDLPVSAYRDPPWTRLRRWGRRHRPLVAAAAAVAVVGLAGLVAHDRRIAAEKAQTAAALQREQIAHAAEQKARRKEAERFDQARKIVDEILAPIADQLASLPGGDAARMAVAGSLVQSYRSFLRDRPDDPRLREQAAMVLRIAANIGRLYRMELVPPGPDGQPLAALYQEAVDLARGLAAPPGAPPEHRRRLGLVLIDRGSWHLMAGRPAAAEADLRDAGAVLRTLGEGAPADRKCLALQRMNLATVLAHLGRIEEARPLLQQALATFEALAATPRPDPDAPLLHIMARNGLGTLDRLGGDADRAERELNAALELAQALVRRRSLDPDALHHRADVYMERGWTRLETRPPRPREAEADFTEARKYAILLHQQHRNLPMFRLAQALAAIGRAEARRNTGRLDDAQNDLREARTILDASEPFADATPYIRQIAGRLATVEARLARDRGQPDAARRLFDQAIAQHEAALKANPRSWLDRQFTDRLRTERSSLP